MRENSGHKRGIGIPCVVSKRYEGGMKVEIRFGRDISILEATLIPR
jgi:hypothetical protein